MLETTKQRQTILKNRKNRLAALKNSIGKAHSADVPFIEEMIAEVKKDIEFLTTVHRFDFNFAGGGWNTVQAYDKEEALEVARREYSGMEVLASSFRLCDSKRYDQLIAMSN